MSSPPPGKSRRRCRPPLSSPPLLATPYPLHSKPRTHPLYSELLIPSTRNLLSTPLLGTAYPLHTNSTRNLILVSWKPASVKVPHSLRSGPKPVSRFVGLRVRVLAFWAWSASLGCGSASAGPGRRVRVCGSGSAGPGLRVRVCGSGCGSADSPPSVLVCKSGSACAG
eukprot:8276309-Pyramimonas_sp.AAC.2